MQSESPAVQETAGQHARGGYADQDDGGEMPGSAKRPTERHDLPGCCKPDDGCDISQPLKQQQAPALAHQKQRGYRQARHGPDEIAQAQKMGGDEQGGDDVKRDSRDHEIIFGRPAGFDLGRRQVCCAGWRRRPACARHQIAQDPMA